MKVALTGASGFIGQHVLHELLRREVSIVAVTRDKKHLSNLFDHVEIVEFDVTSPGVHAFDRLGQPDILLHLAWGGLPNYHSLHHFEHELPQHYVFLRQMVNDGLKSLVVSGSCLEYGMQFGPLSEGVETRPVNPYGFAKEALLKQLNYLKQDKMFNLTWARLFYMYGEGQSQTSLFPQLKKAAQEGAKQFNMSGGEQLRDYLSIEEVACYLVKLTMKQQDFGVVNICSGKPRSVRSLVEDWIQENNLNIKLNLGYYPYLNYEPMAFWGDRRRLDSILEC